MNKIAFLVVAFLIFGVSDVVAAGSSTSSSEMRNGLRATITQKREQVREEIKQTREEVKTRIQAIRDERKKQLAEKLDNRLCEVQKNRVAVMNRNIETISKVLGRVVDKQTMLKSQGKNAASLDAAVVKAQTAITEAKSAVSALQSTDCGVTLSGGENKLREEVSAAISQLEAKVKSAREKVRLSRIAVEEAVVALAKLRGEEAPSRLSE